jgi:superfamily II DNA or RNA helicase
MRFFKDKQKKILYILSEGKCTICGEDLRRGWHADHIKPYSEGGETTINNGQSLCPKCNIAKSNNYFKMELQPRGWQLEAMKKVKEKLKNNQKKALVVAGVGSGKTIFSQLFTQECFNAKRFDNVIIVSPTENIKYNWATTFEKTFNIPIDFRYNFKYHFNQDYKGISITYKSIESDLNSEVLKSRIDNRTLIIVDEVHHAGDTKSWGEGLLKIGENAGFILLLSGTPTRSDNSKIPFVDYVFNKEINVYKLKSDYEYTYADSVKDMICCPVKFNTFKSEFETLLGEKKELNRSLEKHIGAKALNMLLKVKDESSYVYRAWLIGNKLLNEINDSINEDKAGLIIVNSIDDAKIMYDLIAKNYGSDFVEIVHSDDKDSSKKINKFKDSNKSWIISVNMISEGVDIPRIRVIVYMTNIITFLYFMQVLGRGVRNYNKLLRNMIDVCHMVIPDYKPLVDNAEKIEESIKHIVEEIEEKKKKERDANKDSISLFDDVLSATCEDSGAIFKGDHFDIDEQEYAKEIANQHNTTVATVLSIIKTYGPRYNINKEKSEEPFVSMTEKKKQIKAQIHKAVGRIAIEFNKEYKDIHFQLNRPFCKNTNELNYEQLQIKLKAASRLYNKLKNFG